MQGEVIFDISSFHSTSHRAVGMILSAGGTIISSISDQRSSQRGGYDLVGHHHTILLFPTSSRDVPMRLDIRFILSSRNISTLIPSFFDEVQK